jgi:branched-chain amino acid transport system substrate-binding protein
MTFTKVESWWLASVLALVGMLASCKTAPSASDEKSPPSAAATPEGPRVIKVGLLAPFSGPFASSGAEIEGGIKTYLEQHGQKLAGHTVEILTRDTTGIAPDVAKRLAQELITRQHVDFLAGFGLTPNAMAVAPLATESKTPMVIMNAATSSLTTKSPYVVRLSFNVPQVTAPLATWAAANGIKSVYTLVSDYAPGTEAEAQFKQSFEKAGGTIAGSVKVPVNNPDFAPFVQRLKDNKPEAVFVFVPAGAQGIAFMKAFKDRGLDKAGIKVLATGDVTEDNQLPAMGDAALGVISTHHYSAAHVSPENDAFKALFAKVTGGTFRPNFMAVGGYDGMAAIAAVVEKLGGDLDGDRVMAAFKGLSLASPRGPIRIDPETRDIIQTVYVRKVEQREDGLYNVEFAEFADQKDPAK